MGLAKVGTGTELHKVGDGVQEIEIVLSGSVGLQVGEFHVKLGPGALLGFIEQPGEAYKFDYVVEEDAQVYSYSYEDEKDIAELIRTNGKLAPAIAMETVRAGLQIFSAYEDLYTSLEEEHEQLQRDRGEYEMLATQVHRNIMPHSELNQIELPDKKEYGDGWEVSYLKAMSENAAGIKAGYYGLSVELTIGTILNIRRMTLHVVNEVCRLGTFAEETRKKTEGFRNEMNVIRMKISTMSEDSPEEDDVPIILNAFDTIVGFSTLPSDKIVQYKELIQEFKALPDRTDTDDTCRRLRRQVTDMFYDVYTSVFFHSMDDPMHMPVEVRMFLMFGFMDEDMAGEKYTQSLYRFVKNYRPDPEGNVVTIYQWLVKIWNGQAVPSKNEFDLDYPAHLKELRMNGEITEKREKALLHDVDNMVRFELENLFKLGNRMTFGRISVFQPVFDSQNVLTDLDRSYLDSEKLHKALDDITSIDGTIFLRERDYNNEEVGISHLPIHKEVQPNIILLPNVGSRAALWQEIEGKKRDTPARFLFPIFLSEDLNKMMIATCGDFRWEMTKTEQGVHWNDLSDPSLTSEYADYIQYYRKNHDLSQDQRERVKKIVQKNGNNLRKIFVTDYMVYMVSESHGSPMMNKVTRGLLFKYCPFAKDVRERIKQNPQYTELLNRYNIQLETKMRPVQNSIHRFTKAEMKVPEELTQELEVLQR